MNNKSGLLIAVAVCVSCTNSIDEAFVDDGMCVVFFAMHLLNGVSGTQENVQGRHC